MKKALMIALAMVVVATFSVSSIWAQAAEQGKSVEQPKTADVTGTVKATKDAEGKVASVSLVDSTGVTHKVVLDENGKKLAELDGKKAKVTAVEEKTGTGTQLKVSSFVEVKEGAAPAK